MYLWLIYWNDQYVPLTYNPRSTGEIQYPPIMEYYYPSPSQLSSQPCYNPPSMMYSCGIRPFNPYQYYRADTGQSCTAVPPRSNTVPSFTPSLNSIPYPTVKDSLETLAAISSSIGSSPMLQKITEGSVQQPSKPPFHTSAYKESVQPTKSKEKNLIGMCAKK